MSSTALSLPKNRYRSSGVSAAKVLFLIGGGACVLLGLGVMVLPDDSIPSTIRLTSGGFILLGGFLGIATGWGLRRRLYWARITGLMCAIGLASSIGDGGGWIFQSIFIGIGVWLLILFSRGDADKEFAPPERQGAPPPAVSAVAWLLLIEPISLPLVWFLRAPTFVFGQILPLPTGRAFSALLLLVGFIVGLSLLKCSKSGFWLAVGLLFFECVNDLFTDFTPSALAELNRILSRLATEWHITGASGLSRSFSFVDPLVMTVVLLLFWKKYKASFIAEA